MLRNTKCYITLVKQKKLKYVAYFFLACKIVLVAICRYSADRLNKVALFSVEKQGVNFLITWVQMFFFLSLL